MFLEAELAPPLVQSKIQCSPMGSKIRGSTSMRMSELVPSSSE
jgi:hypothetical protein